MKPRNAPRSESDWLPITARRRGRCDLCGSQFSEGTRIRYQPRTRRVRCLGPCPRHLPATPRSELEKPAPKRVPSRPVWQGEYVSLFDRGDYWFRKCVVCGRTFEGAAGRVAQAKKRGVCPACESGRSDGEIERLTESALAKDRKQFRAYQAEQGDAGA
jgi:hypothetical protein